MSQAEHPDPDSAGSPQGGRRHTLVQFGAGNIGRSFVGQIFARSGWQVVFVDVDEAIVRELGRSGSYRVVVKHPDGNDEHLTVSGVRAIHGRDTEAVAEALRGTDYVASSVGAKAIGSIVEPLARECERRHREEPERLPFDLILAENIHDGPELVTRLLRETVGGDVPPSALPSVVECSVGKMVPLMPDELRRREPTTVYAEPYNTLIVDGRAWRHPVPSIPELYPVDNITAYVDRKLFIHNLGHAAAAYLGYTTDPQARYLWEVLEHEAVFRGARAAMERSAVALLAAYPESFTKAGLTEHIEDLLSRFRNRALGDTVHRVGRDLPRKLAGGDRVVGALRLITEMDFDPAPVIEVYRHALGFRAPDEHGVLYPPDREFRDRLAHGSLDYALYEVSGLDPEQPRDRELERRLRAAIGGGGDEANARP
jgi:mannitol-1-phosphate 5-dehydrogenase